MGTMQIHLRVTEVEASQVELVKTYIQDLADNAPKTTIIDVLNWTE